jgi:hypothetical protein
LQAGVPATRASNHETVLVPAPPDYCSETIAAGEKTQALTILNAHYSFGGMYRPFRYRVWFTTSAVKQSASQKTDDGGAFAALYY